MEDTLHRHSDGMVVGVNRFWVVRATGWAERLSGGEKGSDGLVLENEQRGHRPQTGWQRFIAAGVPDAATDLYPGLGQGVCDLPARPAASEMVAKAVPFLGKS
jgi:hypothetical protein